MCNKSKHCKDIECAGQEGERTLYWVTWVGLVSDVFQTYMLLLYAQFYRLPVCCWADPDKVWVIWATVSGGDSFVLKDYASKLPWNFPAEHLNKI